MTYKAIDEFLIKGTASEADMAVIRRFHERSEHKRRPIAKYKEL